MRRPCAEKKKAGGKKGGGVDQFNGRGAKNDRKRAASKPSRAGPEGNKKDVKRKR